jgi:hypothetical protein
MNQKTNILNYLKKKGKITPLEALNKFGCFRLSARIKDLREAGHDIKTNIITVRKKRFAEYILKT